MFAHCKKNKGVDNGRGGEGGVRAGGGGGLKPPQIFDTGVLYHA